MNCAVIDVDKIYIGDVGTAIILDVEEDLSDANTVSIEVRKPEGQVVSWSATVFEVTKVRHIITDTADIDQIGEYRMQSKVVTPTGTWYGGTVRMNVYKRFT